MVIELNFNAFFKADQQPTGGTVRINLHYKNRYLRELSSIRQQYSWGRQSAAKPFEMRVLDFTLPADFRGKGIGSQVWSLIYRSLPELFKGDLFLRGSLSSDDARTEEQGNRRDRFWQRMLADEPTLEFQSVGFNGYFKGRFIDPLTSGFSPRNITVSTSLPLSEIPELEYAVMADKPFVGMMK